MLDKLYANIGGKIKSWAKWIFVMEALSGLVVFLVLTFDQEEFILGLLAFVTISAAGLVSTWLLYAFGELVERVCSIDVNLYSLANTQKVEERLRREAEEQARREEETRARRKAQWDAVNQTGREAVDHARQMIGDRTRPVMDESARWMAQREAEEQARKEAEDRARRVVEERLRRVAEERARREAGEQTRAAEE